MTLIVVTNFFNIALLFCIFIVEEDSVLGEALGWAIISISTVLYLVNIGLIISEQVLVRDKILDFYARFCYAVWLIILALFSCVFWICISGRRSYWSWKARRNSMMTTELMSMRLETKSP